MARANPPFLAFNRGLISPKALARVDIERTKLSAEVYNNWLPKTQGALTIRPGTKHIGSSLNDTGAAFIEFVASTDDVALPELTHERMRVWLGEDAHELALLSRPKVDTTVSFSDTGWSNASSGGNAGGSQSDLIPTMTAATTNGVTIGANSAPDSTTYSINGTSFNPQPWRSADDNLDTFWTDTGQSGSVTSLPSWLNVDFGSGNGKNVGSYSVRAAAHASLLVNAPKNWGLIGSNFDTGTFATDTGKWILEDARTNQTGWAVSEKRSFTLTDTGTPGPWRHWRLNFTATDGGIQLMVAEIEMFAAAQSAQATFANGQLTLNATAIGALAKATKRVAVSDTGTEHSLAIYVARGPVTLRVGSTNGDDDYVTETAIGTGYHNLAFTPEGNFWITLQSDKIYNRIVGSIAIGDSGTVELTAPWEANDLANVRYDQSADVVWADAQGVRQRKIERRGTGRSWSVVEYAPDNGPFLPSPSSSAKLSVSHFFGNTTLNSDIPFFEAGHVGALVRMFHEGQGGQWRLGALEAVTDVIEVTGISDTGDTGTPSQGSERRVDISVTGAYAGTLTLERSVAGKESGFHPVSTSRGYLKGGGATDTGTFTRVIQDRDDNVKAWYRLKMSAYTSGVAVVAITYAQGGVTGIARITDYQSNTAASIEVLERFSDTGPTANWQQGYWSDARGYPTAVSLHGGRLFHAGGATLFGSVADDYENFDETTEGDAGPIVRTLGSGPVDAIRYLVSLLRLVIGTAGAEIAARSSSLDEPLTPDNSSAAGFSTQGSANLRAVKMDTRAIFVQRSGGKVFMVGLGGQDALGDYAASELTLLVPDLLAAGVVSIAIQRQPDTRLHCVLADGTVAILTYEPGEDVLAWSTWSTDTGTGGTVEQAMVLPGLVEDAVYYHVRRTINGATRRFLEKWALESECQGDTGLTFLVDCARSYTDTGRTTALVDVATHLVGQSVVAWGSLDTGSTPHVDLSPDVDGVQTTYTVDTGGDVTLSQAVHHAVVGLPYQADWLSAKLAYGAEAGTALAQVKRVAQMAFALWRTHPKGLLFGSDTGHLKPLPTKARAGEVDLDRLYDTLDLGAIPFPGTHDTDARLALRGKSPRPATVLALVPSVQTNERV